MPCAASTARFELQRADYTQQRRRVVRLFSPRRKDSSRATTSRPASGSNALAQISQPTQRLGSSLRPLCASAMSLTPYRPPHYRPDPPASPADIAVSHADMVNYRLDIPVSDADMVISHADMVACRADKVVFHPDIVNFSADTDDSRPDIAVSHADTANFYGDAINFHPAALPCVT